VIDPSEALEDVLIKNEVARINIMVFIILSLISLKLLKARLMPEEPAKDHG